MRHQRPLRLLILLLLGMTGCPRSGSPGGEAVNDPRVRPCPAESPAPPQVPFSRPEHRVSAFWLDRGWGATEAVLSPERIAQHNTLVRGLKVDGRPSGRWDLLALPTADLQLLQEELLASLKEFEASMDRGKRVLLSGGRPTALLASLRREVTALRPASAIRVAHRSTPLRCYPTTVGVYERAWEAAFDLMQCSQLQPGEAVKVLARGTRLLYVQSAYSRGWVDPAALTPPLDSEASRAYLKPDRMVVVTADQLPLWLSESHSSVPRASVVGRHRLAGVARMGAVLPLVADQGGRLEVRFPAPTGLRVALVKERHAISEGYLPLTRRGLLELAFSLLNTPYGWGGMGNNRDCSRMLMDLFGVFGVHLPRNSIRQSMAGTDRVDVGHLGDADKVRAIEEAARRGVVLLYLPGHIMLYLGRDGDHLYALHQFSGYLVPCGGALAGRAGTPGHQTMMRVNRTLVTSLELGRGSSRRSFLERITRLVLFAPESEKSPRGAEGAKSAGTNQPPK